MNRITILALLLAATLSACGSNGTVANNSAGVQETATSSAPESSQTSGASEQSSTTANPVETPTHAEATGFGATDAAWNATHTADHEGNLDPDAVYNPNPSLPEVNGHMGSEYTSVLHTDGHVTGYEYHTNGTAISTMKAKILSEQFPADAHEVWFVTKGGTCAFMLVQSKALAHELGDHSIGDSAGTALVEFGSGEGETYDSESVNTALFQFGIYRSPGEAQC